MRLPTPMSASSLSPRLVLLPYLAVLLLTQAASSSFALSPATSSVTSKRNGTATSSLRSTMLLQPWQQQQQVKEQQVQAEHGSNEHRESGRGLTKKEQHDRGTCEEVYGLLPCSTTVPGNAFLMLAYGYFVLLAARLISDGSELLLQVLDPGIIGGLLLPMLGAMPDAILIAVSGLSGTVKEAQEQVVVGMGVLAGSTSMVLTIVWGGSLLCGRCDLEEGRGGALVAQDKKLTRPWDLFTTGVTTDEQSRWGAWIMIATMFPFFILQLPVFFGFSSYAAWVVDVIALILSLMALVAYCAYQVLSPWLQERKMKAARIHYLRTVALHTLAQDTTWGSLFRGRDWKPDPEVLDRVFRHFDEDNSGALSRSELKGLILGLGISKQAGDVPNEEDIKAWMQEFDNNEDGEIEHDEFVRGMQRWSTHLSDMRRSTNAPDHDALSTAASSAKWELEVLQEGGEELEEELEEDVEDEEENKAPKSKSQIIKEAVILISIGAFLVSFFADPVVESITAFSVASGIPPFFVAFVVTPLASNASEAISSFIFALKRRQRTISLTYSQVYGAISMNNTLCLGTFLFVVCMRGLHWQFSAEVAVIILITLVVGLLGGSRRTFETYQAFIVILLFPISVGVVAFLEWLGWD